MPHARQCNIVDETLIAVGIHQKGVDFDAVDGQPVHIIFLIASPDNDQYLGVAGRIANVARDDIEMKALLRQNTPKSIHKFLEVSWCGANALCKNPLKRPDPDRRHLPRGGGCVCE
jgi:mannitol/fructose-specific phosphotransferase system IIA component (Ntr-type)